MNSSPDYKRSFHQADFCGLFRWTDRGPQGSRPGYLFRSVPSWGRLVNHRPVAPRVGDPLGEPGQTAGGDDDMLADGDLRRRLGVGDGHPRGVLLRSALFRQV